MLKLLNYCVLILMVFAGAGIRISNGRRSYQQCTKISALGNSLSWKCINQKKCTKNSTISVEPVVVCGIGKICCPEPQTTTERVTTTVSLPILDYAEANKVALQKCYEYAGYRYTNYTIRNHIIGDPLINKSRQNCSAVETLIVRGKEAKKMEFPHMALLGYDGDVRSAGTWRCGGTLISDQFILSAAHCTEADSSDLVKWAMLGLLSKKEITMESIGRNVFRIVERINHPEYRPGKNDIALYKLEKPVQLNPIIRPICIHEERPLALGTSVLITGWGRIFADSIESDSLLKAGVKILPSNKCEEPYVEHEFDSSTMFCGGLPNNETNTCQGDSGGPMQTPIPGMTCMMRQVAITSRGSEYCEGQVPTAYTRISYYLPWIQAIVWPRKPQT